MKYYALILVWIFIFSFACSNQKKVSEKITSEEKDPPNILLIIADDLGCDAFPSYNIGKLKPKMPNIENFVKTGIRYTNFWAYPTCSPTRASIITGKHSFRTNVKQPGDALGENETILQALLKEKTNNRYSSAVIGKWHLSKSAEHPNKMGVPYFSGLLRGGAKDYYSWPHTENGTTNRESQYITSKFTDLAIQWVNEQQKPWFLWLAYTAPHTPFHLPPKNLHSSASLVGSETDIDANPQAYFFSMIEALDTEIGRLVHAIPEKELNNTVIIFIGDNGSPNQVGQTYGKRRVKGSLYEGGINVPLVVTGKNISRVHEVEDALVNSTDLFATILELSGAGIHKIHDSKSIVPTFTEAHKEQKEYLYSALKNRRKSGFAIRNQQYKYTRYDNGTEALFDLKKDPFERSNLIDNTSLENVKLELIQQVEKLKN